MSHTSSIRRTGSALGACALTALLLAAPATAQPDPGTGGRDFQPGTSVPRPQGPTTGADDDALELLDVGAGILAGVALAGAGAALVSRRHHGHPTPA